MLTLKNASQNGTMLSSTKPLHGGFKFNSQKISSYFSGRVTCDFDSEYPDANSLAVKKNEIIDVSLR